MSEAANTDRGERVLRAVLPVAVLALGVLVWHLVVKLNDLPPYILPGPGLVFTTLVDDGPLLFGSLLATLETTLEGFALAVIGGVVLAVLFNQSRLLEHSLYPCLLYTSPSPRD